MFFEMLTWGSVIAIALGVVAPILFAAALKIFTKVDASVTSAIALGTSGVVLSSCTVVLTAIGLWGGPFLALLVLMGGLACAFVAATTITVVGLVPRRGY